MSVLKAKTPCLPFAMPNQANRQLATSYAEPELLANLRSSSSKTTMTREMLRQLEKVEANGEELGELRLKPRCE